MKIVFFDIDGTLAERTHVPASAAEAVRKLRDAGSLVFICTGRSHHYVKTHFGSYADGFICHNGRFAIQGEDILYDHPVSFERIQAISEIIRDNGAAMVWYGRREGWYYGSEPEYDRLKQDEEAQRVHNGLSASMKAYSFNVHFPHRQILTDLEGILKDQCIFNPHGPLPHADVTVMGYDKGSALKAISQALKVEIEDTYAFGDGINDISMLQAAGHGIAMGNAAERLKEKAEYVTTDIHDDGIRNGLLHYGLISGE